MLALLNTLYKGAPFFVFQNSRDPSCKCSHLQGDRGKTLRCMLLKCGYPFHHDCAHCTDTTDAKSCASLLKKYSAGDVFHSNENITSGTVKQLTWYSRNIIRKHLNTVHGGRAIKKYTDLLPLPNVLKEYLLFTEELSSGN